MKNAPAPRTKDLYTVFLVDDDADDREFFSEALEEVGKNVGLTVFSNGEEVLSQLRSVEELPDVIFLDLYMPKMDGRDCLKKIRSYKNLDSICIIMYSTLMDLDQIDGLFKVGANRYLKKPSSYPALKNALNKAIESVINDPLGGQSIIDYSE